MKEAGDKWMGPRTHFGSQTSAGVCPWGCGCCAVPTYSALEGPSAQAGYGPIDGPLGAESAWIHLSFSVWEQADITQSAPGKARGPPPFPYPSL